ncbi:hypothetical protein [Treponema pectinovorum]|uniref:hypothetical protein n=1 Tax=Treponema pectinovorum TaxID=164 RepID=UPI0011F0F5CB|nr:hypothetical protein [Treponema pectinovorum]
MEISVENKKSIKELFFKNNTIKNISIITNTPIDDIKKYLKKENIIAQRRKYFRQVIENGLKEKKLSEEVAAELNCTTYQMCKIAENLKIRINFRKNRFERREKVILEEFEKNPLNITKMAKKLGYSYMQVQMVYKTHDLLKKVSRNYPYLKLNEQSYQKLVYELKHGNKKQSQLAKEFGITRQRIYAIKKKLHKNNYLP